jgi:starvation-inducible outer membrane lipoprotein
MTAKPILVAAMALVLSGCVLPQKISQTEQDAARYRAEESEKAAYEKCTADSMPGTMQHLACRMSAEKSATPAK